MGRSPSYKESRNNFERLSSIRDVTSHLEVKENLNARAEEWKAASKEESRLPSALSLSLSDLFFHHCDVTSSRSDSLLQYSILEYNSPSSLSIYPWTRLIKLMKLDFSESRRETTRRCCALAPRKFRN